MSMIEIYNEKIFDLLSDGERQDLKIREDLNNNVEIVGLTEVKNLFIHSFHSFPSFISFLYLFLLFQFP